MAEEEHDHMFLPMEKTKLEEKIDQTLYKARRIIFLGEIQEYPVLQATKQLESMALEASGEPILIILNSIGGSAFDGLLLFDTIRDMVQRRGMDVVIEVRGVAASMAAIILQAGSRRRASKYTRFLLHESRIEVKKDTPLSTTEQQELAEESRRLNRMLDQIVSERTGKSIEEIETLTKRRDLWLSAEEAKEFGLIDEVV